MDKKLLVLLEEKRREAYTDPQSIAKKYDEYLQNKGIYRSLNREIFEKNIRGHIELSEGILELYRQAYLENERVMLLEDLEIVGYDKDHLVELILQVFFSDKRPTNLWEYADLLYSIKNFRYMSEYLTIINDASYGSDRQMLILLVGESKQTDVIPTLTTLLSDPTVFGHCLDALSNFSNQNIIHIMQQYANCNIPWVRRIAINYLKKTEDDSVVSSSEKE